MSFYEEVSIDELKSIVRDDPSELDPQLVLIRRLAVEDNVRNALTAADQALDILPENGLLLATKAFCLSSIGEVKEGYMLTQVAMRRGPCAEMITRLVEEILPSFGEVGGHVLNPQALIERVEQLESVEKDREFIARLESTIELAAFFAEQPDDVSVVEQQLTQHVRRFTDDLNMKLELARLYASTGADREAERCYLEVLESDPLCVPAYFEIATLLENPEQAIEYSRKGLELYPGCECARINLGAFLIEAGNFEEGRKQLARVPADSYLYTLSLWNTGKSLLDENRIDEAKEIQEKIVALTPEDLDAWNQYSHLCYLSDEYEAMLAHADKAIAIDSEDLEALNNRALALGKLARHKEALDVLKYALTIEPNHEHLLINLALEQSNLGDNATAIKTTQAALEKHPESATLWLNLGSYHIREEELEDALRCSRKALELNPEKGRAYWNIACVYAMRNDKENCLPNLEKSVALSPEMAARIVEDDDLKPFLDDPRFKALAAMK